VGSDVFLFLITFLASGVEVVEALTIVLGVGVVRGWRSPLLGVVAATVVLGAWWVLPRRRGHARVVAQTLDQVTARFPG
jgi:hypothetical protein